MQNATKDNCQNSWHLYIDVETQYKIPYLKVQYLSSEVQRSQQRSLIESSIHIPDRLSRSTRFPSIHIEFNIFALAKTIIYRFGISSPRIIKVCNATSRRGHCTWIGVNPGS